MDFQRYVNTSGSTLPSFPAGLDSWGFSGKGQFRATMQVGRTWEEIFKPMKASDPNTLKFIAYINSLWRERTIFTIAHPHLSDLLGDADATDTPLLNGTGQSGSSIITDGWTDPPGGLTVLRAGDVIKISGINIVYDVIANCVSDGSGNATIQISPPLYPPANWESDGKSITFNSSTGNVKFRAVIAERPQLPQCDYTQYYIGLKLMFREVP